MAPCLYELTDEQFERIAETPLKPTEEISPTRITGRLQIAPFGCSAQGLPGGTFPSGTALEKRSMTNSEDGTLKSIVEKLQEELHAGGAVECHWDNSSSQPFSGWSANR